jgi:hypothetical protein
MGGHPEQAVLVAVDVSDEPEIVSGIGFPGDLEDLAVIAQLQEAL